MAIPYLQVALDHTALDAAMKSLETLAPLVDIIEAGTILCFAEGMTAVKTIRAKYDKHLMVADLKVADAGETLARMAFDAGANWMTVICAAPIATVEKAYETARTYDADIQIELFGNWTLDDAREWYKVGIRQAIFHRGRDAQASGQTWGQKDLDLLKALSDMGFQPSVTGGITPADLSLFRDINVKSFIVGRALYGVADPGKAAREFNEEIHRHWKA